MAVSSTLVNQQLVEVAQRLATEYDDITAGSVLRCYARAVRRSARTGCTPDELPGEAERLTRVLLSSRRRGGAVSVPRQRGQSADISGRRHGA